ncbi:zinc finger protein 883-like [Erpetoichthys calabaricus]|uniref:Zinc finger protein 883-like n=1 Tax=Erpetoichthys calabaricus TaxID=27687 RepID=A0A8C4RZV8_ERPCA|nr:zinc finger protein 883-like [Erpetoichthys calabaricus]XP_028668207.1 zinc finger protein 883-like [Erpetoichthys calabaricus]XP_028668208.1 zinc finger protein 883-like [Erpetoichthys calabaricus]
MESFQEPVAPIQWVVSEDKEVRMKEEEIPIIYRLVPSQAAVPNTGIGDDDVQEDSFKSRAEVKHEEDEKCCTTSAVINLMDMSSLNGAPINFVKVCCPYPTLHKFTSACFEGEDFEQLPNHAKKSLDYKDEQVEDGYYMEQHIVKFHKDQFKNKLENKIVRLRNYSDSGLTAPVEVVQPSYSSSAEHKQVHLSTGKAHQKHTACQEENLQHQCNECGKIFRDLGLLQRHLIVHKQLLGQISFVESGDSVDKSVDLFQYFRWRRRFRCDECGKSFRYASTLEKHRLFHEGKLPYQCGDCGRNFKELPHLKMHQKIHQGVPPSFCCLDCGKVFKNAKHLRRHKRIHTGDMPYHCSECDKKFRDSERLRRHQRIHTGEMPYPCDECDKRFRFSGDLRKHQRIHTGVMPYQCTVCGKHFRESSTLKKHELIHSGKAPFNCSDCGKRFNQVGNLKRHQQIHTGMAPYKCTECDKCFNHVDNLKRHIQVHMVDSLYHCDECNSSFRSAACLKKHQQVHRRVNSLYMCGDCEKTFKHASDFKKHQRIHTGEMPYLCTTCNKSFNHLGNLKKHLLIHSGEMPFECPDCGKRFNQLGNMKKHRNIHLKKQT